MSIFQAIETRFAAPTNHLGSRVIATAAAGQCHVHEWDNSINYTDNHLAAAEALRAKLDWPSIKAGGATAKGYAFVTSTLEG